MPRGVAVIVFADSLFQQQQQQLGKLYSSKACRVALNITLNNLRANNRTFSTQQLIDQTYSKSHRHGVQSLDTRQLITHLITREKITQTVNHIKQPCNCLGSIRLSD